MFASDYITCNEYITMLKGAEDLLDFLDETSIVKGLET